MSEANKQINESQPVTPSPVAAESWQEALDEWDAEQVTAVWGGK